MSLHQEDAFDARKRYVFAIHPHGVFGCSAWLSFVRASFYLYCGAIFDTDSML